MYSVVIEPNREGDPMKRDAMIVVRVTPELRERLDAIAEAERRSLSNLIEKLLTDAVSGMRTTKRRRRSR